MGVNVQKLGEKLMLLNDYSEGLMNRLNNLESHLASTAGEPCSVQLPALAKVVRALTAKFPEVPVDIEKIQGYDYLKENAAKIEGEMVPMYELIFDSLNYKDRCYTVLMQVVGAVKPLTLESCGTLVRDFMTLFCNYIKVQLLMERVKDRKGIAALYSRSRFIASKSDAVGYETVCLYLKEYENPHKRMQDEFKSLGTGVSDVLMSLVFSLGQTMSADYTVSEGVLDPGHNESTMAAPTNHPLLHQLLFAPEMREWVLFGAIYCPGELANQGMIEMLRSVLSRTWVVHIFRQAVWYPHQQVDALFSWFKDKTKSIKDPKKIGPETREAAISGAPEIHQRHRRFLISTLRSQISMFSDFPGLTGPKILSCAAVLRLAREEVEWYLIHQANPPPKSKTKRTPESWADDTTPELIHLVIALQDEIEKYSGVLVKYCGEYLSSIHTAALSALVEPLSDIDDVDVGGFLPSQLEAVVNNVMSLGDIACKDPENVDAVAASKSCLELRVNWLRALSGVCAASGSGTRMKYNNTAKKLLSRMDLVMIHAEIIASVPRFLRNHGSLKLLAYHQGSMVKMLGACMDSPVASRYCVSILLATRFFAEHAHHSRGEAGKVVFVNSAHRFASKQSGALCAAYCDTVRRLDKIFKSLESQVQPQVALGKMAAGLLAAHAQTPFLQKDTQKKLEAVPVTPIAGHESRFDDTPFLRRIESVVDILSSVGAAIAEYPDFYICGKAFSPRADLTNRLHATMHSLIIGAIGGKGDAPVASPTVVLRRLAGIIASMKRVDAIIPIDMGKILRNVMYGQCRSGSTEVPADTIAGAYKKHYADLLSRVAPVSPYSPSIGGWMKNATTVRNLSQPELDALASLIGPLGVNSVLGEVRTQLLSANTALRDLLVTAKEPLSALAAGVNDRSCNVGALVSVISKVVPAARSHFVKAGNLLTFRENLGEGVGTALGKSMSSTVESVRALHGLLREASSERGAVVDVSFEKIATILGVATTTVDPALHMEMGRVLSTDVDHEAWALLPVLLAVVVATATDLQYTPRADYLTQGASVIPLFAAKLIATTTAARVDHHKAKAATTMAFELYGALLPRVMLATGVAVPTPAQAVLMDGILDATEEYHTNALLNFIPFGAFRSAISAAHK